MLRTGRWEGSGARSSWRQEKEMGGAGESVRTEDVMLRSPGLADASGMQEVRERRGQSPGDGKDKRKRQT